MILISVVWKSQITQQKEQLTEQKKLTELVAQICTDIAVIKRNGEHTTADVSEIRMDVEHIKKEMNGIDKRVSKLEVLK